MMCYNVRKFAIVRSRFWIAKVLPQIKPVAMTRRALWNRWQMELLNTISQMDIFDLCDCLEDDSIDMILCDLPYGITACEWDTVIPLEPMWECFKRIIKPRGAIVLTASQPFTSQLVMSNMDMFRYEIIAHKTSPTGFLDCNRRPMRAHESVLIFADSQTTYNPQMRLGVEHKVNANHHRGSDNYGSFISTGERLENKFYPTSVIKMSPPKTRGVTLTHRPNKIKQHPTQKPVALFEYLIRTYTRPGEVVFDPCVGSGTTALAARNTGRNYIVGDSSAEYVEIARKRIAEPYTLPMFEEVTTIEKSVQLDMGLE